MRRGFTPPLLAGLIVAAEVLLLFAGAGAVAAADISSQGPLTRIIVSPDLTCQVAHAADEEFELFGGESGSCGTFLAFGGNVFGPSFLSGTTVAYTPVSQTPLTGSGSQGDPLRVTTVVEATGTGVMIEQVDTYVAGSQAYRTDVQITNGTSNQLTGLLYRYGDCYLQNQDTGFGRVDNGAPACIVDPAVGQRIEQWTPITAGSNYFEGYYGEGYSLISQQVLFPSRCDCDELVDNGAGLSWPVSLAPGQSTTFSHETFFSPTGRAPAAGSYVQSVPDPTQVNLDPVVLASTAVIAAGVIVLVPFPSALFNSTLEENYDEVMGGVNRIRRRLQSWWTAAIGWLRARFGNGSTPTLPQPPSAMAPTTYAEPMHPLGGPLPGQSLAPPVSAGPEIAPRATAVVEPHSAEAAHDVWRTPLGILVFVALSALFYAFLDPTFGLSLSSLATVLGLTIGLVVILAAYAAPLLLFSNRHRIGLDVRALPATLIVAVICVVLSRLVGFQPGYLYGLIVGFYFAHSVTRDIEGKAEASAAASSLVAAFVAWFVLALLRASALPGEFSTVLLQAATVTIVVAGLENAVFAMLPLRFMPGAAVFGWNRIVWAVLLGLGVFGFAYVLLNPSSGAGYLADTTRTSFFTMIVLLVGFGLASVLFWAWFRFRPAAQGTKGPAL
jgi:hypothetical protein